MGESRETRDADFAVTNVDLERARLRRAVTGSLRGREIRATSPEDFVVLKVLAIRERDLEDAHSVIETQRKRHNHSLTRTEIRQLIDEIPDHDIRGLLARLSAATC